MGRTSPARIVAVLLAIGILFGATPAVGVTPGFVQSEEGLRIAMDSMRQLATDTRNNILGPGFRPQNLGHLAQHQIARGVAQRVVDVLEVVQVEDHQGQLPVPARCRCSSSPFHPNHHCGAVPRPA